MKYQNFDLWIDPPSDGGVAYRVRAESEMGWDTDTLELDPNSLSVTDGLRDLENGQAETKLCQEFGGSLFRGLFHGPVGDLFQKSLGAVRKSDAEGLRVRLRITPPELAAIPWELLYYKSEDCFLSTSVEVLLLRYLQLPLVIRELMTPFPVRVLLVIPESAELDTAAEKQLIAKSFEEINEVASKQLGKPAIECKIIDGNVTADRINLELNRIEYHVFHFIGHGTFANGQGHLLLSPGLISGEQFAYFFLGSRTIKLVLLNSCQGATASSTEVMSGVAQQLLKRNVPAVVAMQYSITDSAAKLFADDFYQRLCIGTEPGRVDVAVSHARKWVLQNLGHTSDFVAPVLLMRSKNGLIFDFQQQIGTTSPIAQIHRLNDAAATHQANAKILSEEEGAGATPESKAANAQAIKSERVALSLVKNRIWKIYAKAVAASLPQHLLVTLVVSVIVFFAWYTKFFNILHIDDRVDRAFISHMVGYVNNPINDNLRIIMIDDGNNNGLGNYREALADENKAAEWRKRHAELIDGLTAAGAKVVVFDFIFHRTTTAEANDAMCKAISDAGDKTHVLVGEGWKEGKFAKDGDLTPVLKQCLKDNWGNTDVGIEHWEMVSDYELAYKPSGGAPNNAKPNRIRTIPSLGLQAVAKMDQLGSAVVEPFYDPTTNRVCVPSPSPRFIPVSAKGEHLNLVIGYARDRDLKDIEMPYSMAYAGLKRGDQSVRDYFKGRIVLVGAALEDKHSVLGGKEPRAGVHIHANVISNILNGFYVYPLSTLMTVLVAAVMAAIGFLLQTRFRFWLRPKIKIPILQMEFELPVLFVVIVAVYLVVQFIVFQRTHVIFDMSYHVVALWAGYALVGIFRKKLGLR
jgi:CHASE2 domain-containing sensor protein